MEMQVTAQNIKCGGCAAAITEALGKLPGVNAVNVDVPTGLVEIQGEGFDESNIIQTLATTGYPVKQ